MAGKNVVKWTAATVTNAIMHHILDRGVVMVPNCNWTGHEADLLVVTKDLRLIDVEVKIDRSDLKADLAKDKWWHRHWGQKPVRNDFAPSIWKHYYAMPAKVWDDKLYEFIPETSGVILLKEYPLTRSKVLATLRRRPKPNRAAKKISEADCIDIARLANLRMWDLRIKMETNQTIGVVVIATDILRAIRNGECPDPALVKAFEGMMVLDVRHDFSADKSELLVWNPAFKPTVPGQIRPRYVIEVVDGVPSFVPEEEFLSRNPAAL